jgi:hypothetical protein
LKRRNSPNQGFDNPNPTNWGYSESGDENGAMHPLTLITRTRIIKMLDTKPSIYKQALEEIFSKRLPLFVSALSQLHTEQ